MKNITLIVLSILFSSCPIFAQKLVSATSLSDMSANDIKSLFNYVGVNTSSMNINPVASYKIVYKTTDVHGNPTIASGALYVPQGLCDQLPIVTYHHGTEFNKENVPSNSSYLLQALLFSGNGYITVLPDYLGMGENKGVHPYMHWESEATSSIDLIRASREYLTDSLFKNENNQLFLTGYSQGGHATMATHKYITTHNLQSEFNVVGSAPLSAALDLSNSQFDLIFGGDQTFYKAEFVPYIASSYQEVYGNLYNNLNSYYDNPYELVIEDYLSKGTYSNGEWESMIPDYLYAFMQDSVINNIRTNENHPFKLDAKQNDLHNWVAYEPVRMLYCGMDSMVTPLNSTIAMDTMTSLGSTDVLAINLDPSGTHETCVIPSIKYALEWFNSLSTPCQVVTSSYSIEKPHITLYPNPVSDMLTCNHELISIIEIYDLLGKRLLTAYSNSINMSSLNKGTYIVKMTTSNTKEVYFEKVVKD